MRQPFQDSPIEIKRFYISLINHANINLYAVRKGYFDLLICEFTTIEEIKRWNDVLPQIMEIIMQENKERREESGY